MSQQAAPECPENAMGGGLSQLQAAGARTGVVRASDSVDVFEQLPNEMLEAVASSRSKTAALSTIAATITRRVTPVAILFFERGSDGRLSNPQTLVGDLRSVAKLLPLIEPLCNRACQQGALQLGDRGTCPMATVAVPVVSQGRPPEAMCAVLPWDAAFPMERVGEMLQFAAAHLTLWYVLQSSLRAEQAARNTAALLEILAKIESCETLDIACLTLVNELQQFLDCQRIAVGICRRRGGHCELKAVSGLARFDKHAELAAAIEAALDETIVLNRVIVWPSESEAEQQNARAHQRLLDVLAADSVIGAPLTDEQHQPVGAWLFVNPRDKSGTPTTENFVRASQQQVGICLRLVQRSQRGPLRRALRWLSRRSRWPKTTALALGMALLMAVLCWPHPHKILCDCKVQPVVRRFVVAPYDGILEKTLVEPGDVVAEGQVLAQMDEREIRLELSGLEADYGRARKAWKVALSSEDISEAQQANLEMKRLDLQVQLLQQRQQNLQIRSPLAGIVVSGDLEKTEGAPLSVGQSLFEIAPLDRMTVEVEIPEEDIAYVKPGMEVRIRLDPYPNRSYSAKITNIVPRAEPREDRVVFLAKTEMDNADELLRPGMNGRVTVRARHRSLAWLLFHKPYESLLMMFGW